MKPLDAFAVGLSGYLLSIAVHAPAAKPITPEQALDKYEQALEDDLFSTPAALPEKPPTIQPTAITPQYIQPAKGTLTSGYGWRWGRMHKGIDIAAPVGTPIVAASAGTVIFSGWNTGGYGYLVEIRHQDGSVTKYAHNSKLLVKSEDFVKQGQTIALMGSTGYSTGSHLHFEIILPEKGHVNPIAFLPGKLAAR